VPALGLLRLSRRRRGRLSRIAGAVSERLTTALGLLLLVVWGALHPSSLSLPANRQSP
jgi:hypothetical protein